MSHGHSAEDNWFGILVPEYMWVWVGLLVLTIIEVIIPEPSLIGMSKPGGFLIFSWRTFEVLSLILLALAKSFMVAWYYMHLISERPAIILVACAPFIFSVFLTIGLFPWPL